MAFGALLVAAVVTELVPLVSSVIYIPYIMEDACDGEPHTIQLPPTGPGSAIIMRSHQGAHYKSGLTCNFIVKTSNEYRMAVVFEMLQFPGTRGNCADSLQLSNVEDYEGPICTSAVKEVISNGSIMHVMWKTGSGAPASSNDGFKAIVTAYKPGTAFCAFSQFKCANQRCVADNFACDGHNNCGDNSDEKCDFGRTFWHDWGSTAVVVVAVLALNVCVIGVLALARRSSPPAESEQPPACVVQQPDGTFQTVNAVPPTPYPGADAGAASGGSQPPPQMMMNFPGATGIPVDLNTGRQMHFQSPPADLANVDYPRAASANPIVMSLTSTSAPALPDTFDETQPAFAAAMPDLQRVPPPGSANLQVPFSAANAQAPPRQRASLFQHSHPPLSLFEQPNPFSPFLFANPGGGPFGPVPFGGGPINLGGPTAMPFGGPIGPMPHRMATLIIIEAGDDDSESQELFFMPDSQSSLLPSTSSFSTQDPVFPTLLIQQRQQQMQRRRQERAEQERRVARRRPRHRRRTSRTTSASTPFGDSEFQDARTVPPETGAIPQPAPPPRPANKNTDEEDAAAVKTVMRIDQIETLTSVAAALQNAEVFGRHISAASGKECVAAGSLVVRRGESQPVTPLKFDNDQKEVACEPPSVSTYESASVCSDTSTTGTETTTTMTTTQTDGSPGTTVLQQTSRDHGDLNHLRPTVSLEDITVLDNAQKRDEGLQGSREAKERD